MRISLPAILAGAGGLLLLGSAFSAPRKGGFVVGGEDAGRRFRTPIYGLNSPRTVDLTPTGNYGRRSAPPRMIVLHWAGDSFTSAPQLGDYFASTSRNVSSHIGVDRTGAYQYLDLDRRAWHARDANAASVGIDITQPPSADRLSAAREAGYDVRVVENRSGRGDSRALSLDPRTREHVADTIAEVLAAYDIPFVPAPSNTYYGTSTALSRGYTVVGHHHVDPGKWDVAPWYEEIMDAVSRRIRPESPRNV